MSDVRAAARRWAAASSRGWTALDPEPLRGDAADATLARTSVLRFDGDGLVREQWDAWNVLDARREPPQNGTPFGS